METMRGWGYAVLFECSPSFLSLGYHVRAQVVAHSVRWKSEMPLVRMVEAQ